MAFKKREEFYSNVGLEPAGNIGRANNSNAVVDGQRPHLGEETGGSTRNNAIAAGEPSQTGNGADEVSSPKT